MWGRLLWVGQGSDRAWVNVAGMAVAGAAAVLVWWRRVSG